jgi:hypothetical protein
MRSDGDVGVRHRTYRNGRINDLYSDSRTLSPRRLGMRTMHDAPNALTARRRFAEFTRERPMLEVALGLLMNLVLVGFFAFYPAQWLGLW